MEKRVGTMLCGLALLIGTIMTAGCFTMPTSPSLVTSGGHSGGYGGGGGLSPTPTPDSGGGGGTGTGTISGTVSNATSGPITITATDASNPYNSRAAQITTNGPYSITSVPDGTYTVQAMTPAYETATYSGSVTVSGGSALTGIDISF